MSSKLASLSKIRFSGSQMLRKDEMGTFRNVLFYCSLILVLPLTAFFTTKSFVFEYMLGQQATIGTNIVSAVVAVITLHLALGLFIYRAYVEDDKKPVLKSD